MLPNHSIVISVKGLKTKYFLETIDTDTGWIEYNYHVKIFLNVLKARTASQVLRGWTVTFPSVDLWSCLILVSF